MKDLESLLFRRQFICGPSKFEAIDGWRYYSLSDNFILSIHPDLPFEVVQKGDLKVCLLGEILDPFSPEKSNRDILKLFLSIDGDDVNKIIESTISYSGRWAIIYYSPGKKLVFADPCNNRTVFYHKNQKGVWFGSQPELIRAATGLRLRSEPEVIEYMSSPGYVKWECPWFGYSTLYENCYQLLPNKYLDIDNCLSVRYFPVNSNFYNRLPYKEIIDLVPEILRGTVKAAYLRNHNIMIPVTGGWDSRLLLAVSREFSNNIRYYVDRMGKLPKFHPDARVPRRLMKKLGVNFDVRNSTQTLPSWFIHILTHNVTGARITFKTNMIYSHLLYDNSFINVNGNGSEIGRAYLLSQCDVPEQNLNPEIMTSLPGYPRSKFTMMELEKWLDEVRAVDATKGIIYHLLYWEQRLGKWGTLFPSEQDIAVDEIGPYNNRLLINTMLGVDRKLSDYKNTLIYKDMIEKIWPELLCVPCNPPNYSGVIKRKMMKLLDEIL